MNRNERALELDKILGLLSKEAVSDDAARAALELEPKYTEEEVRMLLAETDAAFVLSAKFGTPSFSGLKNVTNPLRRAQAGGGLGMRELLDVAETLRAIRGLTQWHSKNEGMHTALSDRFSVLSPNKYLEEKIFTAIVNEEEMADAASPALANIRRKIRGASARARDPLEKLIHSQSHQKHLQESIVTQRSGRYVVPVKAEYRSEVPGLIHDSSASGATVFIEPMAVVEANNEIRVLKADELEEINRILLELSSESGDFADSISESFHIAIELDLIFAKANLAYKMKAVVPKLNSSGRIILDGARHPLIDKTKVVPTNISVGQDFDSLIITGPNTGGKTVALKTVGLLTLMAMCGLMIPAGEKSEISVFKKVLADIGDEQSIEQSLSTFSSHMVNIINILSAADSESLVLLDELGAGTDPVEGAALAQAIIEKLRIKGVRLVCTTHYAELKAFALKTPGVENGSCEFDVASLKPTYRLLIGVPGKSNAFAISGRLGLDEEIVEHARNLVSSEDSAFEQVIGALEENRRKLETELSQLKKRGEQIEKDSEKARAMLKEAEEKAQKELDAARQQASTIVSRTRARSDALINELEEMKRQKDKTISAEQRARLRSGMKDLESSADPVRRRSNESYQLPRELKPGDSVLIFDINKDAVVLESPKDGHVLVQAGIIKTRVEVSNLRLADKSADGNPKRKQRSVTKSVQNENFSHELDIRGQNVEEGLMMVDAFLDRCSRFNLQQVTIIHGKGTGVLRASIHQHLRKCPQVRSFRLGTYGEGESGVTVVELK